MSRGLSKLLPVIAVVYWLGILSFAWQQMMPRAQFAVLFVGGSIVIYVVDELVTALEEDARLDAVLLVAAGLLGVVMVAYLFVNFDVLLRERIGYAYTEEYVLGGLFVLTVLYLVYRSFGLAFTGVAVAALLYAYFGAWFPGLLQHSGMSGERLIRLLTLQFDGFFGNITGIVAAWVSLFLLYAGLLRGYGAFDLILRAAAKVSLYLRSGVAQSAVVASMVIGSINGAQSANAAMTGSFTIPLMKESGIKSDVAAAIEAVASSGGQILPPVMGAAAFVMASFLHLTYFDVLVAGLIPAVMFLCCVAIAVHYAAIGNSEGSPNDVDLTTEFDAKTRTDLLLDGVKFLTPFVVLLVTLGVFQWTVMRAALITCLLMIATGVGVPLARAAVTDRDALQTAQRVAAETVEGFKYGATILAPIVIIILVVNGIVDILETTGMPGTLSLAIIELSGGVLAVAVLASMTICVILGLGMPTVAAYTLVAVLIAPTFTSEFMVPDLAAHYFVFYSAMLSGITPPIAVSVVVTTGIAGSNFWRTCYQAMKIAITLFVLPVSFIYNPEIVGGITAHSVVSGAIVFVGAIGITHGINYHRQLYRGHPRLGAGLRAAFVLVGLVAMVYPGTTVRSAAVVVLGALFLAQLNEFELRAVPDWRLLP